MKNEVRSRLERDLALVMVRTFIVLIVTGILITFSADGAKAASGLEEGTINTVYQVPLDSSGRYLGYPTAVACDSGDNLYFALKGAYNISVVMRMDAVTGEVTRYAGDLSNYTPGSGDGGPAVDANIMYVLSLAFDSKDNLYIADHGNHKVRVVDADSPHIIRTYAGNGSTGQCSGDGGPATYAVLSNVLSVGLDADDNLYIGDCGRVRRVDFATKTISTVAGNGNSAYSPYGSIPSGFPANVELSSQLEGMDFDSEGNLFLGSSLQWVVRKIDSDFSTVTTFAGGGDSNWGNIPEYVPATDAYLNYPDSVSVDADDNVYIGARGMNCIRVVDRETGMIHTVTGKPGTTRGFSGDGGPAKDAQLALPYDMCLDGNGNMYIADTLNLRIRKISGSPCTLPVANLTRAEKVGAGSVVLEWTVDTSTGCKQVENLVVLRDGAEVATLDAGESTYTDTVSESCREYCYTLKTVSGGESATSNERCVITPDTTPPDAPSNITATAISGTEVRLTWDAAYDECDGTAAGYAVTLPDGSTVDTADTSYTVSGLSSCSVYCFTVSAYDSAGNYSGPSASACASTPMVIECGTANNITGKKHTRGSAVPVKFTITDNGAAIGPADIGGLAVKLYKVEDGGMTEISPKVAGSKKGMFKYLGKGVWKVNLKTKKLAPGDYVLSAVPAPKKSSGCSYILLDPAPYHGFTVVKPGGKKK